MEKGKLNKEQSTNKADNIAKYVFGKNTQYHRRLKSFTYFSVPIWIAIIILLFCAFFINGNIAFLGISIFFVIAIALAILWLIIFFIVAVNMKNLSKKEFLHEEPEKDSGTAE